MSEQTLRRQAALPDAPAAAARLLEPLLAEAVGDGASPVSLTLDYGPSGEPGAAVALEAWVERATRTLVFAAARILDAEGVVLATGSAVFRRSGQAA